MLTFNNFTAQQLQETDGFRRKIEKVSQMLKIKRVQYYEIINVEESALDVIIIDYQMYFSKVHLYSDEATKMLNSEFNEIVSSLGLTENSNILNNAKAKTDCNLLNQIESLLSRCMELLNIENTGELDKMGRTASSNFYISIMDFPYKYIEQAVYPLVSDFIHSLYKFKILNLTETSIEILAITEDCRLYQYTIYIDKTYTKFFNRYLSAILPYEFFTVYKRNLKGNNFISALKQTLESYNTPNDKLFVQAFITFLLKKYQKDTKSEGFMDKGLKNVYKFFLDTSKDEAEAKGKVVQCFMSASTYDKKK